MILLTRLNGTQIIVNAELIEFIEDTPDTVITMISGKKILVSESTEVVLEKFVEHKKKIFPYINFCRENGHIEKIDLHAVNDGLGTHEI